MNTQEYQKMTREQLYELSQERGIEGRSDLTKKELVAALELDDTGPEATRLLTEQHDEFRRLFSDFEALSDRPSKRKDELVREMITNLVKHAEMEEQVFYPAVAEEVDGQAGLIDESLEEHHTAELLLSELDHMNSEAPRFDAKVKILIEVTTHHLEEEEQELFPKVVDAMSEERRRELGAAMMKVWRVAPTRPHPHSPDTPPGNLITALPATVIDLTVGAVRGVRRVVSRR